MSGTEVEAIIRIVGGVVVLLFVASWWVGPWRLHK